MLSIFIIKGSNTLKGVHFLIDSSPDDGNKAMVIFVYVFLRITLNFSVHITLQTFFYTVVSYQKLNAFKQ